MIWARYVDMEWRTHGQEMGQIKEEMKAKETIKAAEQARRGQFFEWIIPFDHTDFRAL